MRRALADLAMYFAGVFYRRAENLKAVGYALDPSLKEGA